MKDDKVIIWIIWLIASGIGVALVPRGTVLAAVIFGQFFLVASIALFFFKFWAYGSFLLILGCVVISGVGPKELARPFIFAFGMGICLLILGIEVYWIPMISEKNKRKECTLSIVARCSGRKTGGKGVKFPIWKYSVDEKEYTYLDVNFMGFRLPQKGDCCKLYVNPNNHSDFYMVRSKISIIMNYIVGSIIVIPGMFLIFQAVNEIILLIK